MHLKNLIGILEYELDKLFDLEIENKGLKEGLKCRTMPFKTDDFYLSDAGPVRARKNLATASGMAIANGGRIVIANGHGIAIANGGGKAIMIHGKFMIAIPPRSQMIHNSATIKDDPHQFCCDRGRSVINSSSIANDP